jgi:hypothetical protein
MVLQPTPIRQAAALAPRINVRLTHVRVNRQPDESGFTYGVTGVASYTLMIASSTPVLSAQTLLVRPDDQIAEAKLGVAYRRVRIVIQREHYR